uniref:Subtilisin-like protease SBT5.3 n=1 Tax=Nelumbo nucifera TaxID=4432 RepID=A0A822Y4E1_NELNU|nr:TPA_asm: hypothetical protein HUJ06_030262 [Nelumbo nucifera]
MICLLQSLAVMKEHKRQRFSIIRKASEASLPCLHQNKHNSFLVKSESVVSVFESRESHVHTTHSWEFLGVDSMYQYKQLPIDVKSDMIIGVIDTGIWPESESFDDRGLGPVPKRFKGKCVPGQNFTVANCNRKVIGARYYTKGYEAEIGAPLEALGVPFFRSARDENGHGTHTASTAAGSEVSNASLFGMAAGVARGGAPTARLSIYKACWLAGCSDADLLSAIDDAIDDGVDIISVSVGGTSPTYFVDTIAIGAFHAFKKGILFSASAGNKGVSPLSLSNGAPWILTVAASTVDREFRSDVYLGNSKVLKGYALNPFKMEGYYGVINASAAAAPGVPSRNASLCQNNTLDPTLIKGKIVVCIMGSTDSGKSLKQGGARGVIFIYEFSKEKANLQFVLPATMIDENEAKVLLAYLATKKNPTAKISPTKTVLNTSPAPVVARFSSRGPNFITPDIIKPDITAPGVQILAAWPPIATGITGGRPTDYNIISGTSMSCPHVAGVAAIIKSLHPSWSPSAIKSAIITTASVLDNTQKPILSISSSDSLATPFDYGSGHINPIAAIDPGLVYEFDSTDIIQFLCSYNTTASEFFNLARKRIVCKSPSIPSYNLNYPSIGVVNMNRSIAVHRTVTYYGKGRTIYVASINKPAGVDVVVRPSKLKFSKAGEKKSFEVHFKPYKKSKESFVFGDLTWSNGIHNVRSPIGLKVLSV